MTGLRRLATDVPLARKGEGGLKLERGQPSGLRWYVPLARKGEGGLKLGERPAVFAHFRMFPSPERARAD